MATIENWSIGDKVPDPYTAPENRKKYLQGNIFGDSRFKDGDFVTTSHIITHDYANKKIVTASGTLYTLGKIDPKYVQYMQAESIKPSSFKVEDFQ